MIGAKINLDGESLPDGWSVQLVGDMGEYINGYPFKPTEWKEQGLPIIRIQNLNDAAKPFNYFPDRIDERYLVRDGDILISWSASLGTFLWRRGDAWLNQHIFKALPDETKIDRSFFYWAMVYAIDRIAKNARGSTMMHVTGREFKGSEILLPSRVEQRKIAGVLGVVQRAIEQQERLLQLTTELKKTLLHQLFTKGLRGEPQKQTEIGPVPESWEVVKIGALGKVVTGTTPKTKVPEYYSPPEVDFIAPADLGQTRQIYSSEKKISRRGLEVIRSLPKDAVMCVCIGSSIGKVGMTLKSDSATNQQINSIICSEKKHDPDFVYYLLSYFAEYWRGFATFGPVPILSKGSFEAINIVVPATKDEELEIAQCFTALDAKMEVHMRRKTLLTDLFRTLLHQLMTAQIRVHDLDLPELKEAP